MSTSKTILFFGTDDFSAASLRRLIAEGYIPAAVITKPDSRKGRGRTLQPSIVKEIALEHNIPVWQPEKLAHIADDIRTFDAPLGVLVSFGKIIPQSIIDLFEPGIINVHPSLLPRYRGPSPVESAILNGDTETGVSIMQLSAAMDAGPVYSQTHVALQGTETGPELELTLAEQGAEELLRILPAIIDGSLQPKAQNDNTATYCQLLRKEESVIAPADITAIEAERRVRALITFPKTKIDIQGFTLIVTEAHVIDVPETPLDIACRDNTFLRVDRLVGPNGRAMDAKAFMNGYLK